MQAVLQRWNALRTKQRAFVVALGASAAVAILVAMLLQRDTRVTLFATPLHPEQVAEVAERLAEWNVAFVALSDNVRVDGKRRNEVLLKLALAGVPHPHLAGSQEMLAKSGPLTPQSVIDAQQRDGLAGDLAGGLRGIAGVIDAQVIIAPAHEGAFVDDPSHDATASVRLSLAPGAEMNQATLEGVRQFVAAGVSGLDPKRVTILDDRGLTLDDGAQNPDEAQALQASLQSALDLALGAASTIVRVRVTYDPHVRELHEVVRKPVANRAIASITSDEHFKSSSKQYAKSSASLDRGSDVEDERVETPAGRVERLSVAVAVDQARHLDLGKIRALAAGTLGLDPARGDIVSVEELPFARPPSSDRGLPLAMLAGLIASLAPSLAFALAIVAGVRTGAKPIATICERITHRFALQRAARRTAPHFAPAQVRGALENEPPHTAAAIISALPAATATAVLDMYPPEERAAIVRRMSRAAAPAVPDHETVLRRA